MGKVTDAHRTEICPKCKVRLVEWKFGKPSVAKCPCGAKLEVDINGLDMRWFWREVKTENTGRPKPRAKQLGLFESDS